jgi:hypothetical protein
VIDRHSRSGLHFFLVDHSGAFNLQAVRMKKTSLISSFLKIRASFVLRHSCFVILFISPIFR